MSNFTELITKIINDYGDDTFESSQKTHAILMDLAHDQLRNRLLARHFVEAGGFALLKKSGVRGGSVIIRKLREEFSLEANAAAWITHTFAEALGLEAEGLGFIAAMKSPEASEAKADTKPIIQTPNASIPAVAIGISHTVAMLQDGTAIAHGRNDFLQCDLEGWRNIKAVSAGDAHTVGLTSDGRVLAVGRNNYDQCDVGDLSDIAAVHAYGDDTFCIRKDGSALACGKSALDLSHFENTRSIAWHPEGVYGIRHDGTLMMSSRGWEEEDWALSLTQVVQIISTYVMGSLALTADGRIYKMGEPDSYFAQLRDVSSIADINDGFAALRKDGTVRIMPYDRTTPRQTSEADGWRDIVAIYGKYKRLIGLNADGHLLATCTDPDWLRRNGNLEFLKTWYPVGVGL